MTSTFAEAVTILFIPMAIGLFFVMRPLPATLVAILFADLYLPCGVSFKVPILPLLGKMNLAYLCSLIGCLLRCPGRLFKTPSSGWLPVMALLALVGGCLTGLTNGDALTFTGSGRPPLPGLTLKDGLAVGVSEFFPSLLAVYLGYVLAREARDAERVLVYIAVAGLIYCLFAIVEIRMSPQFHRWVYGYGLVAFSQNVRWGGFRPSVFTGHGLALARFFTGSVFSLFVLAKTRPRLLGIRIQYLAWFHVVVFVLCKSTGAIVFGALVIPFFLFATPKKQLSLAVVLALGTILYPVLRASDLFPVDSILDAAGALDGSRQESMAYRYHMEDLLLAHARERIWFGWGGYGRNRVFSDEGGDITVTDGYWILALGIAGVVGFFVAFGSLLGPVALARRRLVDHGSPSQKTLLAGLAMIVVISAADMIPNGFASVLPFFLAGVLTRQLRELPKSLPAGAQTTRLGRGRPVSP
jgi:hypothetical protein